MSLDQTVPVGSQPIKQKLAAHRQLIFWLAMAVVIGVIANFLPRGFDFAHVFSTHFNLSYYPPWTDGLNYLITWPVLVSITIMALVIAIQRNHGSIGTVALAVISWPTIWVFLDGQLEGIVILGLLLLPYAIPVQLLKRARQRPRGWWAILVAFVLVSLGAAIFLNRLQGPLYYHDVSTSLGTQPEIGVAVLLLLPWIIPLVLLKPQLAMYALLAKKQWLFVAVLWIALSILAWGFWLPNLAGRVAPAIRITEPQDISLFPYSLVLALPLLWFSRGDPEMMMAAGFFASPSVHAYHQFILLPSLARLPVPMRLLCWATTFLSLGANYFGPGFWLTGNIFPLILWIGLWQSRRKGGVSYLLAATRRMGADV